MKTVSVIITSYNQKELLQEAIESVLAQSCELFEILICDDASQDGSPELVRQYEKKYPGLVKGVFHGKNLGISRNRNSGLQAAQGELVAWLDGDDTFQPGKIEREVAKYDSNEEIKWVYSQVVEYDPEKNISNFRYNQAPEGRILKKVISMFGRAPRNPLVELTSLRRIGFFDNNLEMYEDFDLCLRLAKSFKCGYCAESGMNYRVHAGGIHNASISRHVFNIDKLIEKIDVVFAGESPAMAKAMVRQLLFSKNFLLMKLMAGKGQFFRVVGHFFAMLKLKPFSFETYLKTAKILTLVNRV
ncbi:MAG: glycosyltransferase family 2 protein [Desulfobulbaceae bacterium]|nr:glycosyltransferase family 2 protein [Desulfobulbaceae bacterium]